MKKTILILTLLLVSCAPAPHAPAERSAESVPSAQIPAATPTAEPSFEIVSAPALTQVEMLDEQNGWAQAEGLVLRTEDGGENWLNVTPSDILGDPAYAESFFLDAQTGWVLLQDLDKPTYGVIYRTTDGGKTWLWRNTPFGRSQINFLDVENGYALTDLGAAAGSMGVSIWVTNNGGGDFNRVFLHEPGLDNSLPLSGVKNGFDFIDSQNGWIAGTVPQDGFIWFYRTRNGGFSWELQDLAMPSDYENYQTSADAPLFFDGGLGLLPVHLFGEKSGFVFYRTKDRGETWQATTPLPMRGGEYALLSANEIILWDGFGIIYSTDNGGETWSESSTDWQPADSLRKLDFVSSTRGWALVGFDLYRTDDGGSTWEKLGEE